MKPGPLAQLAQIALEIQRAIDEAGSDEEVNLVETKVYVGLNDAETKHQEFETDHYLSILKRVCVDYGVAFSVDVVSGGYIHDDGEYTEEQTIELSFVGVPRETVDRIAKALCVLFHQESVLITDDLIKARSIREVSADDEHMS